MGLANDCKPQRATGYVGERCGPHTASERSVDRAEGKPPNCSGPRRLLVAAERESQAGIFALEILTRIRVPKIGMDAIVVEGASVKELSEGPGHMRETAEPGEAGNAVITGHRDTFFRHIYELTKGDQIQVQRNGRNFTYEVTSQKIVKPEDISLINPTTDSRLTLITCYPTYYIGPAPKRLVVFSKLVESDGQPVSQAVQAHATGQ